MNVSDTELAKTLLLNAGYLISDSINSSDVIIFNTCSVRERAAQKVFTRIGEVRKALSTQQPLIGVMGCVAQLEGEALFDSSGAVDLVIGTRAIDRIATTIEKALNGRERVIDLGEHLERETGNIITQARHSP